MCWMKGRSFLLRQIMKFIHSTLSKKYKRKLTIEKFTNKSQIFLLVNIIEIPDTNENYR